MSVAKEFAFHPVGNTVLLASDPTAPAGIQAPKSDPEGANNHADCYQFYNAGSETVHIGYGKDATEATANSVIPTGTGASATKSYPLPAGAVIVMRFGLSTFFSGINASTGGSVFITPGEGL